MVSISFLVLEVTDQCATNKQNKKEIQTGQDQEEEEKKPDNFTKDLAPVQESLGEMSYQHPLEEVSKAVPGNKDSRKSWAGSTLL